ncbi:MAG: alpha/beta hydrolase [Planctomycetaceae bacterium]|jgi:acetyl esterase/lipase|nr:alpha/beta hydrolase [Planctomycetaceae bacterium]
MKTLLFLTTTLFVTLLIFCPPVHLNALEQKQITLWEKGAPNALGTEEKDKPHITVWFPNKDKATDVAVVVCPGGGYGGLALDHEGKQIGEWFCSFGVTAIILEYRHRGKGYGHPNPLLDVQRAIRTVRFNAQDWGIDPLKIGVMGFSAGGHLASTAGTHFDLAKEPTDEIDKMSCRPDFMILCYPVILFDARFTHRGSQNNLIGSDAPKELIDYYSNEKQVTEKTPPTFIYFTNEDKAVPAENGVEFYLALRRANVPAELHIYQKGAHGQGLAKGKPGNETWTELCKIWLINNGFLKK